MSKQKKIQRSPNYDSFYNTNYIIEEFDNVNKNL